jgi:hypothetical protein
MDSETVSSAYLRDQTGLTARFQPDSLLSAQYFETLHRKTILEPEKRLMFAILEDAIDCFQNNLLRPSLKSRRLFQEAEKWIVEVDGDWIFSFENVCEALGLNPAYVRQGLLRMVISTLGTASELRDVPTRKKRETNESSARKRRRFRGRSQRVGELHKTSRKFKEDRL